MIIFPRVNFKRNMLKGAPPGTLGSAQVTGWSTAEKFIEFMNHFIHHVKPSPEEKVVVVNGQPRNTCYHRGNRFGYEKWHSSTQLPTSYKS